MGKHYRKWKDRKTGRRVRTHRYVAAQVLGRPLLPGEVVHHRDGDKSNNRPENLLVLPSQSHHSSLEAYLRRTKRGQPTLFPDLLEDQRDGLRGTLFEHLG